MPLALVQMAVEAAAFAVKRYGGAWSQGSLETVTGDNQDDFAMGLPTGCALRSAAVARPLDWDADSHVPQVDWGVLELLRGTDQQIVWLDPATGLAWFVDDCLPGQTIVHVGNGAAPKASKTPWLWLGVGGLALWLLLRKKKGA